MSSSNNMPSNSQSSKGSNLYTPSTIYSQGVDEQGNTHDNHTQPGGEGYYNSNQDGSYYYSGSMSSSSNSQSSKGINCYTPYTINSQGVNKQGNAYDNRTQPSGEGYHYSNQDGSYYYKNGDGSTYYNTGQSATYTAPNGRVYKK